MAKEENKVEQEIKRCFVMMPFTTPEGYEKDHFVKIYDQIIKPAIEKAGLKAERVDENLLSTDIVTKIFQGLTECEMAICDLSSRNPNVLYELGIRQAYNKPVLLIMDDKTEKIFDVGGLTTILYKSERLYENVTSAVANISTALKENMSNKENVIDIIKGRLGIYFSESKLPLADNMSDNQRVLSLLSSLIDDVDSIKNNLNNFSNSKIENHVRTTNVNNYYEIDNIEQRIFWEYNKLKGKLGRKPLNYEIANNYFEKYGYKEKDIIQNKINKMFP